MTEYFNVFSIRSKPQNHSSEIGLTGLCNRKPCFIDERITIFIDNAACIVTDRKVKHAILPWEQRMRRVFPSAHLREENFLFFRYEVAIRVGEDEYVGATRDIYFVGQHHYS